MIEILFWAFVGPAVLLAMYSIRSGRNLLDYVETEILGETDPDEAGNERDHDHSAVLLHAAENVVGNVAGVVRQRAHRGVRKDHRSQSGIERVVHRLEHRVVRLGAQLDGSGRCTVGELVAGGGLAVRLRLRAGSLDAGRPGEHDPEKRR